MEQIFNPITIGGMTLKNRLFMAPMSRNRATVTGEATAIMATYYAQRANAGLIISEGMQPSVIGQGFMNSPGLHSQEQVVAWQVVTEAVHQAGGKIFAQLMHAGRIGHPALYPSAHLPVAPSAIAAKGQTFTPTGMQDYPEPVELTIADIEQTIIDFTVAAENAIAAGFDGVEIHAGNGFLPHQFMTNATNQRQDQYGGSVENRVRFTIEVAEAMANSIGHDKVGIRISPRNPYNDMYEDDPEQIYSTLLTGLPALAYVHVMEAFCREQTTALREQWSGTFIVNPHQNEEAGPATPEIAEQLLQDNIADAVCVGGLFLANPDLLARAKVGGPYNEVDIDTFYGGDEKGYTDYPFLHENTQTV